MAAAFGSSGEIVVVNGAGPVGLTFSLALLDRATEKGLPMPSVQIWDPCMTPWRENVIRIPYSIAMSLPDQVQVELWGETTSSPQRLFMPVSSCPSQAVDNSRVHDPLSVSSSYFTAVLQVKQFQESMMRVILSRYPHHCVLNQGRCPPEMMRSAVAVVQCYGKAARKTNPIAGNPVSLEEPLPGLALPKELEHGVFVLFDRREVAVGSQFADYESFNVRGNGFSVVQSYAANNAVQAYIFAEDLNNDTGRAPFPLKLEQLINNGRDFGLKALFECVTGLQGHEDWWWEFSRRCRLQDSFGIPVPKESACTLEWRTGLPGWRRHYQNFGEKASSSGFEAWFDAVRYQISLNLHHMGIFGTHVENFLHKVRLCYARRDRYRYGSVYTEVEGVPVIYLGDSAGSTDFKQGLSCGRGLLCAAQLAFQVIDLALQQLTSSGKLCVKSAFQRGAERYQEHWRSPEMAAEWSNDFDASPKYLHAGRRIGISSLADATWSCL